MRRSASVDIEVSTSAVYDAVRRLERMGADYPTQRALQMEQDLVATLAGLKASLEGRIERPDVGGPPPEGATVTVAEDVQYVDVDGISIAFRIVGDGVGSDLVMIAGIFLPVEALLEDRVAARFVGGLADLGRLVVYDRRGLGCRTRLPIGRPRPSISGRTIS
ncbi:MAG: hypothetical protein P8N02_16385 [Actinomycetota bacterium]|nr:hypothetical protein [Actinomycetota bacterium]